MIDPLSALLRQTAKISLDRRGIENFRGIRKPVLEIDSKSFVGQAPNGSGKSGVVDAIEFALTGTVSRPMGEGTSGSASRDTPPTLTSE